MKDEIVNALMDRVNMQETRFEDFQRSTRNEMLAMQQQIEQLESDKETLEERVEILEALTIKLGEIQSITHIINVIPLTIHLPNAFHLQFLVPVNNMLTWVSPDQELI
jgi:hypothetical protein